MKTIKTYLLLCMAVLGAIILFPTQKAQAAPIEAAAASARQVRVEGKKVTIDFNAFSDSTYTFTLVTPKSVTKKLTPEVTSTQTTVNSEKKNIVHAAFNIQNYSQGFYEVIVRATDSGDMMTVGFANVPGISSVSANYTNRTVNWKDAGTSTTGPTGEKAYYQIRYASSKNLLTVPKAYSTKHKKPGVTSAEFLDSWKSGTFYVTVTPFYKSLSNANYYGPSQTITLSLIAAPTDVNAKETAYKTATVSWNKVSGATAYVVKNLTNGKSVNVAGSKTSTVITDLTPGKTYRFTVTAKNGTKTSSASSAASVAMTKSTTKKVTNLSVSGTKGKHTISWSALSDVDGYKVYFKKKGASSYTVIGATTSTSMYTKRMSENTTYTVMVKPYTLIGSDKVTQTAGSATTNVVLEEASPAGSSVRTIGYLSKTVTSTRLYNTYSSSTVALTVPSGRKIEQLLPENTKYKRCKVLYNGKTYYCKRSNIKSYAANYTNKHYSNAVKENWVNKVKKAGSSTKYLIWVSHYTQEVTIFKGSKGNWKVMKSFICATGKHTTRSDRGDHKITFKEKGWYYSTTYEEYITHFFGRNSFHTRIHRYSKYGGGYSDATIGKPASNGCVRLYDQDAKYIYDNMPKGTKVIAW